MNSTGEEDNKTNSRVRAELFIRFGRETTCNDHFIIIFVPILPNEFHGLVHKVRLAIPTRD